MRIANSTAMLVLALCSGLASASEVNIEYRHIPGGPSMMGRMRVSVPAENLLIEVESFDYMRLSGQA